MKLWPHGTGVLGLALLLAGLGAFAFRRSDSAGGSPSIPAQGLEFAAESNSASILGKKPPPSSPVEPRYLPMTQANGMDSVMAQSLVRTYVEQVEKGQSRSADRLKRALKAQGDPAKEALRMALEKHEMSVATREIVRSTYDEFR